MRKNFGAKPWIYPLPVLMLTTWNEDDTPNSMAVSYGGISDSTEVFMCVSPGHRTTENLLKRKAFTVSMADEDHIAQCDYLGTVSGNSVPDKMDRTGFTVRPSEFVDAPVIEELPVSLDCRLTSYDPETGMLLGEIVNAGVAEQCLGEDGQPDMDKIRPVVFDSARYGYYVTGNKVGSIMESGNRFRS